MTTVKATDQGQVSPAESVPENDTAAMLLGHLAAVGGKPDAADLWEADCRLRRNRMHRSQALVWEAFLAMHPPADCI